MDKAPRRRARGGWARLCRPGRLPVSVHDAPGQDRNGTAVQLMESTLGHDNGQAVEQCVVRDFNFQDERTRGTGPAGGGGSYSSILK